MVSQVEQETELSSPSTLQAPAHFPTSQTAKLKKSPIAPIIIRVYYFL
jgi:hypothetical protein